MINFVNLVDGIDKVIHEQKVNACITLLNAYGHKEFFIKVGDTLPCSTELSEKKALTSYHFRKDNHDIHTVLQGMAPTPLIMGEYCFIPGGKYISLEKGTYYLGVSSDDPSKDSLLANQISQYFN
ncbi:heme-binding protein [Acinetobacter boissieri]|uniref:Uncharacterized conserved protein GlcG, DUF336 family n=1 Tax=Acinetobacter boissieri TaxID=1219383 RepID=A0A1G6HGN9_9GAMM|nr:heme-binding protein [Acinetobacter boissieri]SDB93313.1 Uncharacterized conserved protein GlcG, DUF336 family [Acinetobacter boissieri]